MLRNAQLFQERYHLDAVCKGLKKEEDSKIGGLAIGRNLIHFSPGEGDGKRLQAGHRTDKNRSMICV